jgi:hypothetical protein
MWFGCWPYRCEHCGLRFWANKRYTPHPQGQSQTGNTRNKPINNAKEGPAMAFRTHREKPQAKIVVQAESHEQLNHILLALNQAVNSYQQTSKKQEQTASSFR